MNYYNPDGITNWENLIIYSLIGISLITINIVIYDKFKLVSINREKIFFEENGKDCEVKWQMIKRINRIPFVVPPVYLAKIKESNRTIIFPTDSRYRHTEIKIPFMHFVFDYSEMGIIIKKIKTELEI